MDTSAESIVCHVWKAKQDEIALVFPIWFPRYWVGFITQRSKWISTLRYPFPLGRVHLLVRRVKQTSPQQMKTVESSSRHWVPLWTQYETLLLTQNSLVIYNLKYKLSYGRSFCETNCWWSSPAWLLLISPFNRDPWPCFTFIDFHVFLKWVFLWGGTL
jgi:hypothetical protein